MDYGFCSDILSDNGNQDGGSIFIETSCTEINGEDFYLLKIVQKRK